MWYESDSTESNPYLVNFNFLNFALTRRKPEFMWWEPHRMPLVTIFNTVTAFPVDCGRKYVMVIRETVFIPCNQCTMTTAPCSKKAVSLQMLPKFPVTLFRNNRNITDSSCENAEAGIAPSVRRLGRGVGVRVLSSPCRPDRFLGHSASYTRGTGRSFFRGEAAGA
jgi:hypothetical protein